MKTALLCVSLLLALGCNERPPESPGDEWDGPKGTWVETFRDDFDGPSGSAPDPTHWNVQDRQYGQNQEQDYNTQERTNSFLDGEGRLVIQALKENYEYMPGRFSDQPYTSARLNSEGLLHQQYGRFEASIRLPAGKGLWPAFWLLGENIEDVGWPRCGEVDILEMAGSQPQIIDGSMHGPGYSGTMSLTRDYELESGMFIDSFHTFALEWTAEGMRWLVDGNVYHVRTRAGLAELGLDWVFDQPFYMILNLAVGGLYDGSPDETTPFPSQLVFDYISVSRLEP